jgi:hypothetical protein
LARRSKFLHLLDELRRCFAEFLFKCFGEIGLGLDADADHHFGEGDVFVGHDLYGSLEADRPDEIADGLVADGFYFLIEPGAAHAHFLAEVADLEIGVGQLGVMGVPLFQFVVMVEAVPDRQQRQFHVQRLTEIIDEGVWGLVLFVMLCPHIVFIIHFGSFLYFPPVDSPVVLLHGHLGIEYFGGRENEVVGSEVRFIREEILQQCGGCIILIDVGDIEDCIDRFEDRSKVRMDMGGIAMFDVGTCHHQQATVSVDMIDATLRVIFCDDHQHMSPIRSAGEKVQYSAYSEVIIRHIGMDKGIAVAGSWVGSVVIWHLHGDQLRHFGLAMQPHFGKLRLELIHAELVGNIGVEAGIIVTCARP